MFELRNVTRFSITPIAEVITANFPEISKDMATVISTGWVESFDNYEKDNGERFEEWMKVVNTLPRETFDQIIVKVNEVLFGVSEAVFPERMDQETFDFHSGSYQLKEEWKHLGNYFG